MLSFITSLRSSPNTSNLSLRTFPPPNLQHPQLSFFLSFRMPDDQPPTYHPPPYGTESHDPSAPSPSYELDDLSLAAPPPPPDLTRPPLHPPSHPAASSASIPSALNLDDATIEGCAPKKAPRKPLIPPWVFGTRKGKALVGTCLLLLAGLVGAMIWYGVDRAKDKKGALKVKVDSYLDVARATVVPQVCASLARGGEGGRKQRAHRFSSSLLPRYSTSIFSAFLSCIQVASELDQQDYDLLDPFNFTSPLSSQILFNDAGTPTNFTVFTSTLQTPLRLDPTTFYYVKIFGSRSSKVTFVEAPVDDSSVDMVVDLTAIWKGVEGWSVEESAAWGVKELGEVSGGLHGSNWTGLGSGGTRGVALIVSSRREFLYLWFCASSLSKAQLMESWEVETEC